MIQIKNNLNDFIVEIKQLADKILTCNNKEELYIYLKSYKTYCYLYGVNNRCNILVEEIASNNFYEQILNTKYEEDFEKFDTNFLMQKDNLEDVCLKDLFYLIDILDEFSRTKFYNDNEKLYNKKFKPDELYDILTSFLQEENKQMLDTFKQLEQQQRFYRLNSKKEILSNALTIFNPLTKKSNVLIRKNLINIRYLEAYIHETAHVYDFDTLLKNNNEFSVSLYGSNSLLNETISTFYSLKLYIYMLENKIYENDALIGLANTLLAYTFSLDTASLICALKEEDYFKIVSKNVKEKDIIDLLQKSKPDILINKDLSSKVMQENIDISESIQYSFGYLLSKSLIKNNNYKKFIELENKYPTIADLKEAGFDIEENPKIITKYLEKYL